jgi:hypothetical protein
MIVAVTEPPQGFVDAPILPASGFDVSQTKAPQQHR